MSGSLKTVEEHKQNCKAVVDLYLALIVGNESVFWWDSPNAAFCGKTPALQWEEDCETVYQYLFNNLAIYK